MTSGTWGPGGMRESSENDFPGIFPTDELLAEVCNHFHASAGAGYRVSSPRLIKLSDKLLRRRRPLSRQVRVRCRFVRKQWKMALQVNAFDFSDDDGKVQCLNLHYVSQSARFEKC